MSTFEVFSCAECGHDVELASGHGRTREYVRGHHLPIPDDFQLPTCNFCGETYTNQEVSERLDKILELEFVRIQSVHCRVLVDILVQRHGVTQREIARACDVTPSHLSHVLSGSKLASLTFSRLLESFVSSKQEFIRILEGRPWTHFAVPFYQVKCDSNMEWQSETELQPDPSSPSEIAS